jgi:tetratricopeptide (TPR) repeat protein
LKNIGKDIFEKVNKDTLKEINASSLIQYFVIRYNNENLKDLSILDTPGFGSTDIEDAKRTSEVIREADALFWVFDANTGEINQTSLKIIQENLQGLPLFIVINKADTKPPSELDILEMKIKETIKKNNITVDENNYIPFSKKEKIDVLMNKIRTVPKNKVRENGFIDEISQMLEKQIASSNKDCSDKKKEYNNLEKRRDRHIASFNDHIVDIKDECESVEHMPELKRKLFGKDYYKITKEEYGQFTNALNSIKDKYLPQLSKDSYELKEIEKLLQTAKEEWDNEKDKRNSLENVKNRFDKLQKERLSQNRKSQQKIDELIKEAQGIKSQQDGLVNDQEKKHNKPIDAAVFFEKGEKHFNAKEYPQAIELFSRVLQIEPENGDASFYIGLSYHNNENEEYAQIYYNNSIKLGSDYAKIAYYNMGYIYNNSNDFDKADAYFDKAIELIPDCKENIKKIREERNNK